ncbi:MAG: hypothetical protein ACK4FW_12375, partial [Stenotrophomonas sp.]
MSSSSRAIYLNELGVVCALGGDRAQVRQGLFADQPGGLRDNDQLIAGRILALGEVATPLPDLSALPVGREVVVIGGGLPVVDAAVESWLLVAENVTMFYLRGRER